MSVLKYTYYCTQSILANKICPPPPLRTRQQVLHPYLRSWENVHFTELWNGKDEKTGRMRLRGWKSPPAIEQSVEWKSQKEGITKSTIFSQRACNHPRQYWEIKLWRFYCLASWRRRTHKWARIKTATRIWIRVVRGSFTGKCSTRKD